MIEVNRKLFSRAVDLAAAVVPTRANVSIPILGAIKVTANGSLRLEATDLDNWTCAEVPYQGDAADFTLPQPRMVRAAINHAGGEAVTMTPGEDGGLSIGAGQMTSELSNLPASDYPSPDRIGFEEFGATLGAAEFAQIARVMSAMSNEETRYYLQGVCVSHIADWTYRFAATNGHFLLICDVQLPDAQGGIPNNTIIPRDWLNTVMPRFRKAKEGVRLTYGKTAIPNRDGPTLPMQAGGPRIALRGDLDGIAYSVTGKLIDGQYPDYQKVVPTELQFTATFRRADLVRALLSLTALRDSRYAGVKLTFPDGKISCELKNPDLGISKFEIDAVHNVPVTFTGAAFNGGYLIDVLNALNGSEAAMQLKEGEYQPAVITDPADTEFKAVLMPMRYL